MNDREKILTAAVAALVALWGVSVGWGKYQTALDRNLNQQRNVAQELSTVRAATARGRRAQQKLSQWRRQSLPTDHDIAKSLYQDWLQQQLTAAGLQVKELNLGSARATSQSYQQFSFTVRATGKLDQFTDFLYRFYQARHLHRISRADLKPSDVKPSSDRKDLNFSLTVDALSLADGDREDKLTEGNSDEIELPLQHFRENIVQRNLFAISETSKSPPDEAAVVEKAATDTATAQAKFSAIHNSQEGWLMLVSMQDTGKVLHFREGDTIHIGTFQGTVEQLDGDRRRAILSTGSGRFQVRLGKTLAEKEPLAALAS